MLSSFGSLSLPFYQELRDFSKGNIILVLFLVIAVVFGMVILYQVIIEKMEKEDRKIIIFGTMFIIISLLPFLGLGNITSRYSYLSSIGFVLLFVFFLKKLYSYLIFNGQNIASACIVIVVGVYSLVHIIQLQKIKGDWLEAGKKSERFIIALNEHYTKSTHKTNFYFVDVPIRQGDAWIFPVGLNDAVWFVFRNENINIYQMQSLSESFNAIENPLKDKVFNFGNDGSIIEIKKLQDASIIPN